MINQRILKIGNGGTGKSTLAKISRRDIIENENCIISNNNYV